MANFYEISKLSDFQIMDMIKHADETTLAIALLDAPEEIRRRLSSALSDPAANRVNELMKKLNAMSERELIIETNRAALSAVLGSSKPKMM